jgi:hypothetical protein
MTAAAFIAFFVLMWVLVSVALGFFSGWYSLMRAFPDRPSEDALAIFKGESGMVGPVSMHGVLRLSPCPSGLRVGIMKLFGPFEKDFLVPWNSIAVSRKRMLGWRYAELYFGVHGKLRISDLLADRLWQTIPQSWPEKGMPEAVTNERLFHGYFLQWLILTTIASAFFIIAPRIVDRGSGNYPPLRVAILFPAIVIGLAFAFQYLLRRRQKAP